jgi:hypothetical protein
VGCNPFLFLLYASKVEYFVDILSSKQPWDRLRSLVGLQDRSLLLAARHGGENKKGVSVFDGQCPDLRQGSDEAAPRSDFTAVLRRPSAKMVIRWPLPHSLLASVSFGRRQSVYNNVQARSQLEGPRTPAWKAPGAPPQVVLSTTVSCLTVLRGVLAAVMEHDLIPFYSSVLCAKNMDLFVISIFVGVLLVIVPPLYI